jgi:hypothetical protein
MLRRDFLKIGGGSLAALPLMRFTSFEPSESSPPEQRESTLWIHGSPYLGHSDYRKDFRGLTPNEIKSEMTHFRTAEPWRRAILFGLKHTK